MLTHSEVKVLSVTERNYLGKDTFGTCMKDRDPRTGKEVVLKTFPRSLLRRLIGACIKTRQLESIHRLPLQRILKGDASLHSHRPQRLPAGCSQAAGYTHNDSKPDNICARKQEGSSGPKLTVVDVGMVRRLGTRSCSCLPRIQSSIRG